MFEGTSQKFPVGGFCGFFSGGVGGMGFCLLLSVLSFFCFCFACSFCFFGWRVWGGGVFGDDELFVYFEELSVDRVFFGFFWCFFQVFCFCLK